MRNTALARSSLNAAEMRRTSFGSRIHHLFGLAYGSISLASRVAPCIRGVGGRLTMPLAVEKPLTTDSCGLARGRPAWNVVSHCCQFENRLLRTLYGATRNSDGAKFPLVAAAGVPLCRQGDLSPMPGRSSGHPPNWLVSTECRPVAPLERLHPGEHLGAVVPAISTELDARIAPARVLPQPAHRHRLQLGDLLRLEQTIAHAAPPYASRREDLRRTACSARRKNHRHRSTPAPDLIIRVPHRAARLERRGGATAAAPV